MSTHSTQLFIDLRRSDLHDAMCNAIDEYISGRIVQDGTTLASVLESYLAGLEDELDNSIDAFLDDNDIDPASVDYAEVNMKDDETDEDVIVAEVTVEVEDEVLDEVEVAKKSSLDELAKVLNGLSLTVADKLAILNIAKKGE